MLGLFCVRGPFFAFFFFRLFVIKHRRENSDLAKHWGWTLEEVLDEARVCHAHEYSYYRRKKAVHDDGAVECVESVKMKIMYITR